MFTLPGHWCLALLEELKRSCATSSSSVGVKGGKVSKEPLPDKVSLVTQQPPPITVWTTSSWMVHMKRAGSTISLTTAMVAVKMFIALVQ